MPTPTDSVKPQAGHPLAWTAILGALGVAGLVVGVELREGSWYGVASVLLDAFKNPSPLDVVPLVGVVALSLLSFLSRFSRRWILWTCGVTTFAYALLATGGFEVIELVFNIFFGLICAGIPVLIAALVGRLVSNLPKLPRAGLMLLGGAGTIPIAFTAYMSVFGI